ncbi:outer membrane protein assembly factor [Pseudoluteimonas lycopersici]|uniref:Translocation and assembly module subunit TamA n=1 Tax=Pseudoluteimonas lycopersici TaxID=1324796 RepID=A0A516V6I6_9GAMM|nr:autotransporter assembly complex family protein [Lysobacter lycopersici]QDQ74130.1 outer membrane protein assembly factor [Lysobacter lycopersici]
MRPSPLRLPLLLLCCAVAIPAQAITVTKVDIGGLADPEMVENVRVSLSLGDAVGKDVSGRRLGYLLREAEAETREALEPFGYYSPTITVQRSDRSAPEGADDATAPATTPAAADAAAPTPEARAARANRTLSVSIRVELGEPVRVRGFNVGVDGAGAGDRTVRAALDAFVPRPGAVLDHALYESSKSQVSRALAAHGYFDADFSSHRVEVTRAEHAADIDLRWSSGERHLLGDAAFSQTPKKIIRDKLLRKLVHWTPGDPYDEAELDRLRRSLVALDYFGVVDVSSKPEDADDLRVPVQVDLTPAPRSIYSAGLSYGTVSGPGVRFGVERRYLNSRGHKALAQVDYANKRKVLTLQYRVPAFAWLDGWYTASLQAADIQDDYVNSRRVEFVASRSGQYNDYLNLVAAMHALRERWAYNVADDGDGAMAPIAFRYASFVYPSLSAEYVDVDNRLAPRRGAGGTLMLRGGRGGSDYGTTFAQVDATASWFHGFDAVSRLIVRGELGHTFSGELLDLPPSLRFYAGGDRSVRGYGWHEIGPRVETDHGFYYTGASNVVVGSVEYERYFKGPWGAAVFVDSGSAFDGTSPDMHTGVGIGLRWRSPVGPVRIDLARGLDDPDSPFTIGLNIGADL